MKLTSSNYHSVDANKSFWSVSLFKAFDKCEAAGLAQVRGQYKREETIALQIGTYVDHYFTGEDIFAKWVLQHPEYFNSRTGALKADFKHADKIINTVECQPLMMDYLTGDKQVIKTAELFGVPWKIKMDVFNGERIVDLKVVRDFEPLYKEGFGRVSWIEYWGYDVQGAIYQKVEQIASGRDKPLPFYIVAVTKEKIPDVAVIQIPQSVLDTALKVVEAKIDEFDLVKTGEIPPQRCERCEYCKSTKILTEPSVFDIEEA